MSRRILSTSTGTHRGAFRAGDWALFWAIGIIWGSSFFLIAIGLETFRPGLISWLRVVLGALALGVLPQVRRAIDPWDRPRLVALSFLWVAIPFTLFPLAQQHINSAVTGMLNGGTPLFAATIATIFLRRLPARGHLAGLAVGFVGVSLIALTGGNGGSSEWLGVVLVMAATLCYGFAINISAPLQQRYGSVAVMGKMLVLATIWTTPFGLASLPGSSWSWGPALATAALGFIGTGLAFVIMATLVGRVGSTRASFMTYVIPVVAMILGVAFRDDRVKTLGIVGVGLVIAGALLASRREH